MSVEVRTACPIDGCDYSGEPASVEAHISRLTDDGHGGRVGREFCDVLEESSGGRSSDGSRTVEVDPPEADEPASDPEPEMVMPSTRTVVLAGSAVIVAAVLYSRLATERSEPASEAEEDRELREQWGRR